MLDTVGLRPLAAREIELAVDASKEDKAKLYSLMNDPIFAPLLRGDLILRGADVFAEVFARWDRDGEFGHRFFVRHQRNGCIGFAWEYRRDLVNGHSFFSLGLLPEVHGCGYGALAAGLFVDFLFRACRIDRVYAEVYEYNYQVLKALRKSLKRYLGEPLAEGFIPRFKNWNGNQWDKRIFCLSRADWYTIRPSILRDRGIQNGLARVRVGEKIATAVCH